MARAWSRSIWNCSDALLYFQHQLVTIIQHGNQSASDDGFSYWIYCVIINRALIFTDHTFNAFQLKNILATGTYWNLFTKISSTQIRDQFCRNKSTLIIRRQHNRRKQFILRTLSHRGSIMDYLLLVFIAIVCGKLVTLTNVLLACHCSFLFNAALSCLWQQTLAKMYHVLGHVVFWLKCINEEYCTCSFRGIY